ncbi:MAG: hypothetical protein ACRELT_11925, partial [Longimicrobiales bacterium]
ERGGELMQYEFSWPTLDAAFAAAAILTIMLALVAGAALWAVYGLGQRLARRPRGASAGSTTSD